MSAAGPDRDKTLSAAVVDGHITSGGATMKFTAGILGSSGDGFAGRSSVAGDELV